MSQDFHTANFKYIKINEVGLRTILHSTIRHDITYDFRITEKLHNDIIDKKLMRYLNITQNLILSYTQLVSVITDL